MIILIRDIKYKDKYTKFCMLYNNNHLKKNWETHTHTHIGEGRWDKGIHSHANTKTACGS